MAELPSTSVPLPTDPPSNPLPCPVHPAKLMDLFCEDCEEVICNDCATETHEDHQCGLVVDVFPKHRDEILAKLQPMKNQLAACNKALADLDDESDHLTRQQEMLTREVDESIRKIHDALEARKEELFAQLDEVTDKKLKNLAVQQKRSKEVYSKLSEYHAFIKNTLETGSELEIVALSGPISEQVKELTATLRPELFEPTEQADQEFSPEGVAELAEKFRHFGEIVEYASVICLEKCRAEGRGLEIAVVGERASAMVYVMDQEGREYIRAVDVSYDLVSSDGSSVVRGEGKRARETGFVIGYQSPCRGQLKLHIRVAGTDIPGSPFSVESIVVIPDLSEPWGLAVSDKEEIIVAESASHCISVFRNSGEKLRSFGSKGNGPRQLHTPCGIALTAAGDILVCDSNNHRIQLFSPDGLPLKSIGTKGKRSLQFNEPVGIAVHPRSGKIYVTEFRNNRVQILNADFTFCSKFGRSGAGCGEFYRPYGIAFDSTGSVYVVERYNHRVQVFSEDGEYKKQFGLRGMEGSEERLNEPIGIAIDSRDTVYICNTGNHRITLFSLGGHYLRSLGRGCEEGAEQFQSPFDVVVDRENTVYITDCENGRIVIM